MGQKIYQLGFWKKKPIIICTVSMLVVLLLLIVRIAMPCQEYYYEGNSVFQTGVSGSSIIYDGISLSPGVYMIELQYVTDMDLEAVCNVQDGTVFTGGLLSNGEHFYSGLGVTGYAMWLFEGTSDLKVTVDYSGKGQLTTGNLVIKETNQLWTMLMVICVSLWLLICSLLTFWYYDKKYEVEKEKKQIFFWLTVISLIASVPYLCGYNITGADLTYHLQRIEGVKDGLLGGQFPVRLEPRWLYDHGYANAIFYCNAFLYFPAILRLLGFTVCASYNAYCIFLNIATAWVSYYCFSRMFGKSSTGLICSALHTLSIFRIYKLLITSATGEGTAVLFLPLVIYGLYRIFTEDPADKRYKTAWIPVMLGFAGLIQSHVLTCEITAFVTLVYCLIHIRKVFCRNTFLELTKGAVAAVLVSLWFLVPFLDFYLTQDVHIKHVSARTIQDRGLYFAQLAFHFWITGSNASLPGKGMQYSHPVGIGMVLLIGLGVFLIVWFSGGFRKQGEKGLAFTKVTALIGVMLLYMSLRCFPWDRIQFMNPVFESLVSSLQFPNRFLGWGTVCLVLVFGYCLLHYEKRDKRIYYGLIAVAIIGVATSSMYLLDHVNRDQNYFTIYNEEGMGFGYISGGEYVIEGTDSSLLTFSRPVAGSGVEISRYEKKYLSTRLDCVNDSDRDSFVQLPILLYKGYKVEDAATGGEMQIFASDNKELCIQIPAGYSGSIQISYVSPIYWRIAEVISLGTVVLLICIGWRYWRRRPCQR